MEPEVAHWVVQGGILLVGGVVSYLLNAKDKAQERVQERHSELFDDLYNKHTDDVNRLHDLEVRIASEHYVKSELDGKFNELKVEVRDGFKDLGTKFDKLTDALLDHITREEGRK